VPITPGGLGITELGLIGILADGAGHKASAQVTAAVLMYRAVTYLPSIPLGAIACLTWRYAPALISTSPCGLPQRAFPGVTGKRRGNRRVVLPPVPAGNERRCDRVAGVSGGGAGQQGRRPWAS
jgi:hypothetical protein